MIYLQISRGVQPRNHSYNKNLKPTIIIYTIKKNLISVNKKSVPGMDKLPIVGKMFKGQNDKDIMNELLVFIAPMIL